MLQIEENSEVEQIANDGRHAKYNFPFPLLADENKEVIRAFGVWGLKKFMGREYDGIHRKTFLVC